MGAVGAVGAVGVGTDAASLGMADAEVYDYNDPHYEFVAR